MYFKHANCSCVLHLPKLVNAYHPGGGMSRSCLFRSAECWYQWNPRQIWTWPADCSSAQNWLRFWFHLDASALAPWPPSRSSVTFVSATCHLVLVRKKERTGLQKFDYFHFKTKENSFSVKSGCFSLRWSLWDFDWVFKEKVITHAVLVQIFFPKGMKQIRKERIFTNLGSDQWNASS